MTRKLVDNKIAPNKSEYYKKFLHPSVTINSQAGYDRAPIEVIHGAATLPKTMAMVCEDLRFLIGRWQNNEMEGGKKSFPGDVDFSGGAVSAPAIKEGHLLSGEKEDARDCVNYTNAEMKQFSSDKAFDWRDGSKYHHVHKVKSGDKFDI
ncbi:MAG: hypothetical protein O7C60_02320 [Rickettsia endosymbiont of Ixodes persulcatus]|nr:hypothetical protein [Rickettsia endosymbiont of Ixodes persulcatus]